MRNGRGISVYDFFSEEKRGSGSKHFEESIRHLSSHEPIVYQARNYLILYYSGTDSKTRTLQLTETAYGVKLELALKSMRTES